MKSIVVEGWTGYTVSLAVLNMEQLAAMSARSDIRLFHREMPSSYPAHARRAGLLQPDQEERIRAIPAPPADLHADAVFRITHPYLATPDPRAGRTWVWAAAEMGLIEPVKVADRRPVREAMATPGVWWITCSRWSARGLVASGADPSRVAVVHCGFNPGVFHPVPPERRAELRRTMGWEGRFVFLNVSTMNYYKGVHVMLTTFVRVARAFPQALLVLKGSDTIINSAESLRSVLVNLPPDDQRLLAERTRYMGDALHASQVADLMRAADCYLSPYHGEGFNMPVLEAAAVGLPSLVTGGGPTEEFTTNQFAWRIPSTPIVGSPIIERIHGVGAHGLSPNRDALMQQMSTLIQTPELCRLMGQAGPPYVRERFTWDHIAASLTGLLTADDPGARPEMRWQDADPGRTSATTSPRP